MTPRPSIDAPSRGGGASGWTAALGAFALAFLAALLAYRSTVASLANVWGHSDTFAYGFLILPVCIYLAWRSRESIARIPPRPYPVALIGLIPLGLAWIVGRAASTLFLEQLAFVAMIPLLVTAQFGPRVARALAFPLAFLFFAVPFGDVFTPRLMGITADLAEHLLRWSGIVVAREGLYLITTTSRWHVVESCSGLRFTIAGVVLATLFAHLSYRSNVKRALFVAAAVVVSILANGIRAYVLILVGYMTDLRLGRGFDHYAYGWLVFTIVMTAFFLAGAVFRDREAPVAEGRGTAGDPAPPSPAPRVRWLGITSLAVAALAVWPSLDLARSFMGRQGQAAAPAAIAAPAPAGPWALAGADPSLWRPFFHGAASEANRRYDAPDGSVQCYIAYYANQSQGRELLHVGNSIVDENDPRWRVLRDGNRRIQGNGAAFTIRETDFRMPDGHLVVWHWYWLPDEYTTSTVRAKMLQARARLLGRRDHAAVVVLAASAAEARDAERLLAQFSGDMLPSIHRSLRDVYDGR